MRQEAGQVRQEAGQVRQEAGQVRQEAGQVRQDAGQVNTFAQSLSGSLTGNKPLKRFRDVLSIRLLTHDLSRGLIG